MAESTKKDGTVLEERLSQTIEEEVTEILKKHIFNKKNFSDHFHNQILYEINNIKVSILYKHDIDAISKRHAVKKVDGILATFRKLHRLERDINAVEDVSDNLRRRDVAARCESELLLLDTQGVLGIVMKKDEILKKLTKILQKQEDEEVLQVVEKKMEGFAADEPDLSVKETIVEECSNSRESNGDDDISMEKENILQKLQQLRRNLVAARRAEILDKLQDLKMTIQNFSQITKSPQYLETAREVSILTKQLQEVASADDLEIVAEIVIILRYRAAKQEKKFEWLELLEAVTNQLAEIKQKQLEIPDKIRSLRECASKLNSVEDKVMLKENDEVYGKMLAIMQSSFEQCVCSTSYGEEERQNLVSLKKLVEMVSPKHSDGYWTLYTTIMLTLRTLDQMAFKNGESNQRINDVDNSKIMKSDKSEQTNYLVYFKWMKNKEDGKCVVTKQEK